jgi:hypothetical protein
VSVNTSDRWGLPSLAPLQAAGLTMIRSSQWTAATQIAPFWLGKCLTMAGVSESVSLNQVNRVGKIVCLSLCVLSGG